MGSCYSRPSRGFSSHPYGTPNINYSPTTVPPPNYTFNEHNEACRVLRPWELQGGKSRNFKYVVYVINNNLLNKPQALAQEAALEHIQQLAAIHQLSVLVKCLDYLSEADHDPDAAKEKQLYKDMLATEFRSDLVRMWDERPAGIFGLSSSGIHTSEERIDVVINKIRGNREMGDSDIKNQIEPEVVAALSRFTQGWELSDFLKKKNEIFQVAPTVDAGGISKLQAQFILQSQVAHTSLTSENGAMPTVAINFVPDEIPNITLDNIKRQLKTVFVPLAKRAKDSGKAIRQDLYTMQLISLGTANSKGGQQWKELDDLGQGGMDIVDHLHLDCGKLLSLGPGILLGQKTMLGSIEPDLDRALTRGSAARELYGTGVFQVTKENMDACYCQKPEINPDSRVV